MDQNKQVTPQELLREQEQKTTSDRMDALVDAGETAIKAKQTLGQWRVGLDFNPSGDPKVSRIKQDCATVIDNMVFLLGGKPDNTTPGELTLFAERGRLITEAITLVEDACMKAVKSITKQPRK